MPHVPEIAHPICESRPCRRWARLGSPTSGVSSCTPGLASRAGFQASRIDTTEMHRHEERDRHRHRHRPGWAGWWVDAATYDLRQSFPCSEATVSRHCWVRSHLSSSVLQRHFSEAAPRYKGEQEKSYEGLSPCVMKSLPRVFRRSVVGGGGVDVDSRPDKIRAMMSLLPPSHLRAPSPELSFALTCITFVPP